MSPASPALNRYSTSRSQRGPIESLAVELRSALLEIDDQIATLEGQAAHALRSERDIYLDEQLATTSLDGLYPRLKRRALNALRDGGITTVGDALGASAARLDSIPGVGAKTIQTLTAATTAFETEVRGEATTIGQAAAKPFRDQATELRSQLPDKRSLANLVTAVELAERAKKRMLRRPDRELPSGQAGLVQWLTGTAEPTWRSSRRTGAGHRPDGNQLDAAGIADATALVGALALLAAEVPPHSVPASPIRNAWESEKGKRWIIAGAVGVLGVIGLGLNALADNPGGGQTSAVASAEATTTSSELDSDSSEATSTGEVDAHASDPDVMTVDEAAAAVAADPTHGGGSLDETTTTTESTTTAPPPSLPPTTLPPTTMPLPTLPPTTLPPITAPTTVAALAEVADEVDTTEGCNSNYSGCVPIASDVDCAGGSGNGPAYVSGPVRVLGSDVYDLDRNSDGYGCEDNG